MAYRKLGRNSSNRKALFLQHFELLHKHERIETTVTKAKEVSSHVAKLITLAKQGDLHAVVKFLQFSSMKKLPESFLMKSLRNSRKTRRLYSVFTE